MTIKKTDKQIELKKPAPKKLKKYKIGLRDGDAIVDMYIMASSFGVTLAGISLFDKDDYPLAFINSYAYVVDVEAEVM